MNNKARLSKTFLMTVVVGSFFMYYQICDALRIQFRVISSYIDVLYFPYLWHNIDITTSILCVFFAIFGGRLVGCISEDNIALDSQYSKKLQKLKSVFTKIFFVWVINLVCNRFYFFEFRTHVSILGIGLEIVTIVGFAFCLYMFFIFARKILK